MTLITKRVRRVMHEVGSTGPRAGLLAGWVFGLADAYGTRDDRALDAVAAAGEAWSSILFGADPLPFLQRVLKVERPALRSRLRAWIEAQHLTFPDTVLPEAVFTLLVATEATIELAGIEDPAAVRRLALAYGLRLDPSDAEAAWAWLGEAPQGWTQVVSQLPPTHFLELLDEVELPAGRRWEAWRPHRFEPSSPFGDDSMARAASWLDGGKQLRSRLCRAIAAEAGVSRDREADAVEWIHRASLAVDDIMDDAPVRRGRTSLHVRTDEPFAMSVALRVVGEVLSGVEGEAREVLIGAVEAMVRGQIDEWAHAGNPVTVDAVEADMQRKTGALFAAAAELGGTPGMRDALQVFGMELGVAFQVVDDLLDATGDPEAMGKATGADRRGGRRTLVDLLGVAGAEQRASDGLCRALQALEQAFGRPVPEVEALARSCVERQR